MSTAAARGSYVAATVLYQEKVSKLPRGWAEGDELWLTLPDLAAASGWVLKPDGVCRDEACVPVPDGRRARFLHEEGGEQWFNLAEFARLIDQPFAHDEAHHVWCFGPPSWEWQRRVGSRQAPDFTLPDLAGELHSLSELQGKKVLLACWASW